MRPIEVFKEQCRKEKEEEVKDKEGYEKWDELRGEQDKLSVSYQPYTFLFWNFCPNCNSSLDSKTVKKTTESSLYLLFSCKKCGYEYAY